MQYFFVTQDRRSLGPFSLQDLVSHPSFQLTCLVWRQGMSDWQLASSQQEVRSSFENANQPRSVYDQKTIPFYAAPSAPPANKPTDSPVSGIPNPQREVPQNTAPKRRSITIKEGASQVASTLQQSYEQAAQRINAPGGLRDNLVHGAKSLNQRLDNPLGKIATYTKVQDIANVNYQLAFYLCTAYVAAFILFRWMFFGYLGAILGAVLTIGSWYYFAKFFAAIDDKWMTRLAHTIAGSMFVYSLVYLMFLTTDWGEWVGSMLIGIFGCFWSGGNCALEELDGFVYMTTLFNISVLAAIVIVTCGIIMLFKKKHTHLPVRRIGVAAMICVPLYMTFNITDSVRYHVAQAISESAEAGGYGMFSSMAGALIYDNSFIFNTIIMIPYMFLAHHFYKAHKEDLTPENNTWL